MHHGLTVLPTYNSCDAFERGVEAQLPPDMFGNSSSGHAHRRLLVDIDVVVEHLGVWEVVQVAEEIVAMAMLGVEASTSKDLSALSTTTAPPPNVNLPTTGAMGRVLRRSARPSKGVFDRIVNPVVLMDEFQTSQHLHLLRQRNRECANSN
eukprot:IDg14144t1